jgi:integrase
LRTAELRKLEWKDVYFEAKVIEVTGRKSKTRQRRPVDISENLAAWLLHYRSAVGLVAPNWFRGRLEKLRVKAGIGTWPKNGMRHSFVSYYMAQHQNLN